MPYYSTALLSRLPASFDFTPSPSHHIPTPIDPTILASVKNLDFVGYAAYPASVRAAGRRNQISADAARGAGSAGADKKGRTGSGGKGEGPMFRSERERAEIRKRGERAVSVDQGIIEGVEDDGAKMPSHYRKVEIKYSRFGVEDFDFG